MSDSLAQARAALKALGYHTRRVSIRNDHSTLRFTVRDASVNLAAVYAIATRAERIDRCPISQEILCGGNTYTDVVITRDVAATLKAPLIAVIAANDQDAYDLSAVPGLAGVRVYRQDAWTWSTSGANCYHHATTALEAAFAAWWERNVVAPARNDNNV